MDKAFSRGNEHRAEEMLRWSKHIQALGYILTFFAEDEGEGPDAFGIAGECIGEIIQDYGRAIENSVETAFHALSEFYENGEDSLVSEMKRKLKHASHPCPNSLTFISECLKKTDMALAESKVLFEIRAEFLKKKKEMEKSMGIEETKKAVGLG